MPQNEGKPRKTAGKPLENAGKHRGTPVEHQGTKGNKVSEYVTKGKMSRACSLSFVEIGIPPQNIQGGCVQWLLAGKSKSPSPTLPRDCPGRDLGLFRAVALLEFWGFPLPRPEVSCGLYWPTPRAKTTDFSESNRPGSTLSG